MIKVSAIRSYGRRAVLMKAAAMGANVVNRPLGATPAAAQAAQAAQAMQVAPRSAAQVAASSAESAQRSLTTPEARYPAMSRSMRQCMNPSGGRPFIVNRLNMADRLPDQFRRRYANRQDQIAASPATGD